jgi:hypothetical protein
VGDNAGQSSQKCRPADGNRDVRDTTATSTRYDVPVPVPVRCRTIIKSHSSRKMIISPTTFEQVAREMLLNGRKLCNEEERRRFKGAFGASFRTISALREKLEPKRKILHRAQAKHLLWTLVYFKVHKSEPIHCTIVGCKSQDTFRDWVNKFAVAISELECEVIDLSNRFKGWDGRTRCLICIDGTDIKITEPIPRGSIWWSHKHNAAGLRYEASCHLHKNRRHCLV